MSKNNILSTYYEKKLEQVEKIHMSINSLNNYFNKMVMLDFINIRRKMF